MSNETYTRVMTNTVVTLFILGVVLGIYANCVQ